MAAVSLRAPSSPHAYSTLQDPPPEALAKWSLASRAGVAQALRLIKKNLKLVADIYQAQTLFWMAIIVVFIVLNEAPPPDRTWIFPMLVVVLLPAGYLLVIVVDRYLWVTRYLFLLMGAASLALLRRKLVVPAGVLLVAGGLGTASILWSCLTELRDNWNGGREEFAVANRVRELIPPESHIASCGSYERSLEISFWVGARYYGLVSETPEEQQYARELNPNFDRSAARNLPSEPPDAAERLRRFHIQWLLEWPDCPGLPATEAAVFEPAGDFGPVRLLRSRN